MIIKFHRWPNSKQQKEIIRRLKSSGLKKTKSIKNFNTWLFEWFKGDLKPSKLGEKTCKKLEKLSYVKRCNPDHLLPLNHFQSFSKVCSQKSSGSSCENKGFLNSLFWKDKSNVLKRKKSGKDFLNSKTSLLLANAMSKTEAGFVEDCTSCRRQNSLLPLPLNIKDCNLISQEQNLMDGKLSDYWAQELIGSDLLREELEKIPPPKIPNWIAVFDSQRGDHNFPVKNLISDEGLHAVLPELDWNIPSGKGKHYNTLSLFETMSSGDYVSQADLFGKSLPHFINNSMSWAGSEDIYEVFEKLSPPAIVVTVSGNTFPLGLDSLKSKASKKIDTIVVGSFSSSGFVSEFSNSGKEVHIMAPSDDWITSANKNGEYKKFGGTSGATPLVTGSLAGFEWLSGYHPTPKEAKILLEQTALPTLHSHEEPQINGMGLLNAYKLGKVGKRLKERCRNKSLSCFKDEILNEEIYHFDVDENLKRDLRRTFPSCTVKEKPANFLDPDFDT